MYTDRRGETRERRERKREREGAGDKVTGRGARLGALRLELGIGEQIVRGKGGELSVPPKTWHPETGALALESKPAFLNYRILMGTEVDQGGRGVRV